MAGRRNRYRSVYPSIIQDRQFHTKLSISMCMPKSDVAETDKSRMGAKICGHIWSAGIKEGRGRVFRQAQRAERPVLPSIEQRPAIVNERKRIGDWEDDTMVSKQSNDRLKTINERFSGVVLIGKMKDGTINESNRAVKERLGTMPKEICKTLTRDRGTENMGWKELEEVLGIDCYFARAYCSQDRGSNENANGLIRRYFPKKTDFAKISDEQIRNVEYLLNTRPRKRHGGKTPLEILFERTGVAITY